MVEIEEIPDDTTSEQDISAEEASGAGLRQRATGGNKSDEGNFVDLTSNQDGKVRKKILKEGTGEPIGKNKAVLVHYTGRFPDGKVFDSSLNRGQPLQFNVGQRQVILGWDLGVASMKIGEKAVLICHPDFAYGSSGAGGVIPPNATLEFEVELLAAEDAPSHGKLDIILFLIFCLFVLGYTLNAMYTEPENKDLIK
mmetsp:Transcript_15563/g.30120  ORF Transcript_15563/g.30120 Transcript_15563/m.30120 type:complete len:197 (+) Transcript_15563:278-868(+)|eukprot:CAMPEP_0171502320 /NCGR_PEP_ID=MMETSP0958-20121227/10101_1 /TAXON_ID=87120 /ORGANISM="Aurantiochytrium limacinum, Strain ATCCMYA-1381" /LENGTH=196 /DNA_ID=CAMNT_0012037339 /DNA_START=187 /DNA_END=777 /DNA_ORIENTATION=+